MPIEEFLILWEVLVQHKAVKIILYSSPFHNSHKKKDDFEYRPKKPPIIQKIIRNTY